MRYFVPSVHQVSTTVSDETVILQFDSGEYYNLNEVGSFIWELIQGKPHTLSELIQRVCENFEIDFNSCEHDIKTLLKDLENEQLIAKIEEV